MWTPVEIFFIVWYCNFSPDENARLKVSDLIEIKEEKIISKIVQNKENQIINSSVRLRDDFQSR